MKEKTYSAIFTPSTETWSCCLLPFGCPFIPYIFKICMVYEFGDILSKTLHFFIF